LGGGEFFNRKERRGERRERRERRGAQDCVNIFRHVFGVDVELTTELHGVRHRVARSW
jgi:hypothetical protein